MQEFTKEQQDFIKEHGGKTDIAEPPWVGCEDEEQVKTEVLSLSADKRNFVRAPPGGVEFQFDMAASFPVALALLREDPELSKMRYEIVPKLYVLVYNSYLPIIQSNFHIISELMKRIFGETISTVFR